MNDAPTPGGRGHDRPKDAEPFFPTEGTFNTVVPLSEVGRAPAPFAPVDPADVGRPAEAAWASAAHRAARRDEEETLVPLRTGRARKARPSWVTTAAVIALSVLAGLVSGTYLIRSSQHTAATPPPAEVAAEAPPALPPVAGRPEAVSRPEKAGEAVKQEEPAKVERTVEAAHASKPAPPALQPTPAPRAERVARAADGAREVTPAPRPTRSPSAPPSRPRPTTVVRQTPGAATPERTPPISTPPPAAKSQKVIQWP